MTRLGTDRKRMNNDTSSTFDYIYTMQSRREELMNSEDAQHSRGEGAIVQRIPKQEPIGTPVSRPPEPTPLAGLRSDSFTSTAGNRQRQSSFGNQKPSAPPTLLQASPSKRLAQDSSSRPHFSSLLQSKAPGAAPVRQTSINRGHRYSIASTATSAKRNSSPPSESFDFLPTVNFDDLHTSIFSNVPDIDSFPTPGGTTFRYHEQASGQSPLPQRPAMKGPSRTVDTSELRSWVGFQDGTMRRQDSGAQRKPLPEREMETSISTGGSLSKGNHRKSHFQSTTTSGSVSRAPRKSVGPGILSGNLNTQSNFPRPSLAQATFEASSEIRNSGNEILVGSQSANFESARNQKAKSFQAAPRKSHGTPLTPTGGSGPIDFFAGSQGQSPGRSNPRTTTPSSNKRLSIMPNSAHATGLAARTISPTDARRLKRMSMMPNPPPVPFTPPTPQPDTPSSAGLASVPSPSLLPRKSVTPSSSRTTPDPNRKSYSSGFSISSSTSCNSNTGPNGGARASQSFSTSRLPTLKSRVDNQSLGDDEIVPPVPAIPKAYESPKDEVSQPFFSNRQASLTNDVNGTAGTSTAGGGIAYRDETKFKPNQLSQSNRTNHTQNEPMTERKPSNGDTKRRTLQPLRLPPLNLLPLSTPTATKIAALYDGTTAKDERTITPPPKKGTKMTPTTPMTASKASFSRAYHEEDIRTKPIQIRSSSSHHIARPEPSSYRTPSSSSTTLPTPRESNVGNSSRTAISPFVSSSLPKSSSELNYLRREMSNPLDTGADVRHARPTGPRLPKPRKLSKEDGSRMDTTSSIEPPTTPSFGTSLRRKLSLTRKRSVSKAQTSGGRDSEVPPQPPKHDDMPPPKLPASATWSGPLLPSPSPVQNKGSSRNVSSSETLINHERNRSSTWDAGETLKKTAKPSVSVAMPVSRRTTRSLLEGTSQNNGTTLKDFLREAKTVEMQLDRDDLVAEEEMKRLASKRKETENAAKELDALTKRATAKDRVSPTSALRMARLNIFERGEIVDYREVYFCGTQSAKKHVGDLSETAGNFGYDDDRGDYNIVAGDHLAYRYEVVDILGKGSFGQVARCVDHKTGGLVAIKIIRNKKRFHQQALVEVDILKKIRDWDPHSRHSMVNFTQSFYFRGHLCISTELLGMNLYEFIKCHDFRGFSIKLIRRFAKQLLSSLVLLKSKRVIHCDLKPENVLLCHPARSEIKVIDFGSSCLENEKVYTYIQSRFYRSPEVILGMTYGMPIDMWSLGCILAELLTGYPIFPGENEQEQLACIMEVFGPPEKHLIEKSTRKKLFFDSVGKPRITVSSKGKRRRPSSKSLQQALKCEDEAFLDFITRSLRWDPDRRLKPDDAINHEFITGRPIKQVSRPRTATTNVSASPLKRYNSITQTPGSNRPLPEPPVTNSKTSTVRNRETSAVNVNTSSPMKQAQPSQRRNSTVIGLQMSGTSAGTSAGMKRTATGTAVQGSTLPKVASTQKAGNYMATGGGRGNVSSDLAAAAAAASLAQKTR